jgi:hypothetical protein
MYTWIWRKLPGGLAGKLAGSLVLLVGVVAFLFLVVFPWAGPKLPFNHVTVDTPTTTQSPAPSPTPTHTHIAKPAVPT